jgi:very-short-patch-repair endonuclease
MTTFDFIQKAIVRYGDRYVYTNSIYLKSDKPITIACILHGSFTVGRAEKHLTGQECPTCCKLNTSSFELQIKIALEAHKIKYEREKTFDGCRSPSSNHKLKYDFFLTDLNILLEFDGEHHFTHNALFNQKYSLEKCQIHDAIKDTFAANAGIGVIRLTISTISTLNDILLALLLK